jgi:heme/copper-type cytochrome/quinol oxidase subunit 1
MLGKLVIIVGIIGVFIVNFFSRKKIKNSNSNSEKNIDETFENQTSSTTQFSNQDQKINFKDDGFNQ